LEANNFDLDLDIPELEEEDENEENKKGEKKENIIKL
jgi:hypothetical protein